MHRVGDIGGEGAGGHRIGLALVIDVGGAHPPGAGNHIGPAIRGVEMRLAEIAGIPFDQNGVRAGLIRVAEQGGRLHRAGGGAAPLDIFGRDKGQMAGIWLDRLGAGGGAKAGGQTKGQNRSGNRMHDNPPALLLSREDSRIIPACQAWPHKAGYVDLRPAMNIRGAVRAPNMPSGPSASVVARAAGRDFTWICARP